MIERPARHNVFVDMTIWLIRNLLNRLELWRMAHVRVPEPLTPADAFAMGDEILKASLEDWEDGDLITAEDDRPAGPLELRGAP